MHRPCYLAVRKGQTGAAGARLLRWSPFAPPVSCVTARYAAGNTRYAASSGRPSKEACLCRRCWRVRMRLVTCAGDERAEEKREQGMAKKMDSAAALLPAPSE